MYKKAIAFYKTSRPGLILALVFATVIAMGIFKAANPGFFYQRQSGVIDTAISNIGYYQRIYELRIQLQPEGKSIYQSYPIWWYAPHPDMRMLRSGTHIDLFVSSTPDQQMYGIQSDGKVIQPAWFDILNTYFNSGTTLTIMICCLLLISIYHYVEVINNPYLWLPYAMGMLIISFFSGYLTAVILLTLSIAMIRTFIRKKKRRQHAEIRHSAGAEEVNGI